MLNKKAKSNTQWVNAQTLIPLLPENENVHTVVTGIAMFGADVPKSKIVKLLTDKNGAYYDEEGVLGNHHIVVTMDGFKTFIECSPLQA